MGAAQHVAMRCDWSNKVWHGYLAAVVLPVAVLGLRLALASAWTEQPLRVFDSRRAAAAATSENLGARAS